MGLVSWVKDKASSVSDGAQNAWDSAVDKAKSVDLKAAGHMALDVAGMVPVVGAAADVANAGWYAAEGDWTNAALSAAGAVPGIGDAATAAKLGKKAVTGAKALSKTEKATNAATTTTAAAKAAPTSTAKTPTTAGTKTTPVTVPAGTKTTPKPATATAGTKTGTKSGTQKASGSEKNKATPSISQQGTPEPVAIGAKPASSGGTQPVASTKTAPAPSTPSTTRIPGQRKPSEPKTKKKDTSPEPQTAGASGGSRGPGSNQKTAVGGDAPEPSGKGGSGGNDPIDNSGSVPGADSPNDLPTWKGPTDYSHIANPKDVTRPKPTPRQVEEMKKANRKHNDGILRDDVTGEQMVDSAKSQKGVTPPSNEAQVDHIFPASKGGTRESDNLQLRTRKNNRDKWDNT